MLSEPGKQFPATGHCSTTMPLIPNCFFADVCPKAVTISKLPCQSLCRLEQPVPSGPSHLYKTPKCHRTAAGLQVQNLLGPKHCALPPALLTQEGSPSLPVVLLPALPRSRAGILSRLTCQVQLQGAWSSIAHQGQFGHHHIWSVGI